MAEKSCCIQIEFVPIELKWQLEPWNSYSRWCCYDRFQPLIKFWLQLENDGQTCIWRCFPPLSQRILPVWERNRDPLSSLSPSVSLPIVIFFGRLFDGINANNCKQVYSGTASNNSVKIFDKRLDLFWMCRVTFPCNSTNATVNLVHWNPKNSQANVRVTSPKL